jgi:hypothetical protein
MMIGPTRPWQILGFRDPELVCGRAAASVPAVSSGRMKPVMRSLVRQVIEVAPEAS